MSILAGKHDRRNRRLRSHLCDKLKSTKGTKGSRAWRYTLKSYPQWSTSSSTLYLLSLQKQHDHCGPNVHMPEPLGTFFIESTFYLQGASPMWWLTMSPPSLQKVGRLTELHLWLLLGIVLSDITVTSLYCYILGFRPIIRFKDSVIDLIAYVFV